jgi:hypothetical protein
MRKVIVGTFLTLDGVEGMASYDGFLMGRTTYEITAPFFPSQPSDDPFRGSDEQPLQVRRLHHLGGAARIEQLDAAQGRRRDGGSKAKAAGRQGPPSHRKWRACSLPHAA